MSFESSVWKAPRLLLEGFGRLPTAYVLLVDAFSMILQRSWALLGRFLGRMGAPDWILESF